VVSADSQHAQLEIHNDWLVENREMLDETDQVTVTERDGVYVIDFYHRLAAVFDYLLRQTVLVVSRCKG
jgi:hypothetical protein